MNFDLVKTLKQNTNNNAHSENVLLIASRYGTVNELNDIKKIHDEHIKTGHIEYGLAMSRHQILNNILSRLDPKLKDKIYNAL